MKTNTRFLFPFFLFLAFSCSNNEASKGSESANSNKDEASTAACKICLVNEQLINLEKDKVVLTVSRDECSQKRLKKVNAEFDSLTKVKDKMLSDFGLDRETAWSKCSQRYPTGAIKDAKIKDSILLELYSWDHYFQSVPFTDTTCETKIMEGDKIGIKYKGELYWMSQEEYDAYINKQYTTQAKIDELILQKRKQLVSRLTGISNPDEYCLYIVSKSINISEIESGADYYKKYGPSVNAEIKELEASLRRID